MLKENEESFAFIQRLMDTCEITFMAFSGRGKSIQCVFFSIGVGVVLADKAEAIRRAFSKLVAVVFTIVALLPLWTHCRRLSLAFDLLSVVFSE